MGQGDQQARLPRMVGQACDTSEQQRATGDGLPAGLRMGKPDVPAPPVVDQGHGTGREIAALQILRGVASPAPLVLEFIEAVLAIGPVPVQQQCFAIVLFV